MVATVVCGNIAKVGYNYVHTNICMCGAICQAVKERFLGQWKYSGLFSYDPLTSDSSDDSNGTFPNEENWQTGYWQIATDMLKNI